MTDTAPQPDITPVNKPWWDHLAAGKLTFQRCGCGHKWLPPRVECPTCLKADSQWEIASGEATLVSWVVFHTAYHPAFANRLPYNVAVVQLAEGPRLVTNIVDAPDGKGLSIGMKLRLALQKEGETVIPRFQRISE